MTSDDLRTALQDRLADAHPDLDSILAAATRQGRRIRAVRRSGVVLGAAAVVAAVGVGIASLAGTSATSTPQYADGGDSPTVAPTTPASATLHAGQVFDLGHHVTATIHQCTAGGPDRLTGAPQCAPSPGTYVVMSSTRTGSGTGYIAMLSGPAKAVEGLDSGNGPKAMRRIANGPYFSMIETYQGLTVGATGELAQALNPTVYAGQDVRIHLAGWKQVGPVGDDKQSLEGPNGAVADIVWRPASDYAEWTSSSDKGATPDVWTSTLHDGVFVSIQGGLHTTAADIQALGESLTWDN